MAKAVKPIPDDALTATPYLCIKGAEAALEFYKQAFGAAETRRLMMPDGRVGHAEIAIGPASIMLADEFPEMDFHGPTTLGGSCVTIYVHVEDVDTLVARAVAAGATLQRPIKDEFYGERTAQITDPFGHRWLFATRIEEVSTEEMQRRAAEIYGGADAGRK
jgi:PhnB protein